MLYEKEKISCLIKIEIGIYLNNPRAIEGLIHRRLDKDLDGM
jgi:hypothetical protein